MKVEKIVESSYYQNLKYKRNNIEKLKLINYVINKSIECLYEYRNEDNLWNSRASLFVKAFFSEVVIPRSLSLVDILEYIKNNKNHNLKDYINNLPGIEYELDKYNLSFMAYENHGYLTMQLTNILIIENFLKLNKFVNSDNVNKVEFSSFFFNDHSIGIKDKKDSYIFKEEEFEVYKEQLVGQPIDLIKLYFY